MKIIPEEDELLLIFIIISYVLYVIAKCDNITDRSIVTDSLVIISLNFQGTLRCQFRLSK